MRNQEKEEEERRGEIRLEKSAKNENYSAEKISYSTHSRSHSSTTKKHALRKKKGSIDVPMYVRTYLPSYVQVVVLEANRSELNRALS